MVLRSRAVTVQFLRLVALLAFLVPGAGSALAAETLPQGAEVIAEPLKWLTITNSMIMVWVVAGVIILVSWLRRGGLSLCQVGCRTSWSGWWKA